MADGHDRHDLALVVAYADGEASPDEERVVVLQVAACSDCAALVDDLRALALADRAMATPPRPRDFRLTTADATMLAALAPEPVVPAARLVSAMTPAEIATHATHDPELIAAAASGGATDAELVRAESWLSTCAACVELRDDLVAIAVANRTLPTPARTRDFVLSEADARRLQSGGWRGLLARIGTSRDAFSRPLAVGLTTLGLAGLVLASGPSLLTMSASGPDTILSTVGGAIDPSAKSEEPATDESTVFNGEGESPELASAAPAAPEFLASAAPSAAAAPVDTTGEIEADGLTRGLAGGSAGAAASDAAIQQLASQTTEAYRSSDADRDLGGTSTGPSPLVILSLAMLAVGIGLFVLRRSRRRQRT